MPSVDVKTNNTGHTQFHYVISTPQQDSADCIDPDLPTVLFLHAVYLTSSIYHYQFGDPNLRRFNLVAVDLKLHGYTSGDNPPASYNQHDAAEEIARFMPEEITEGRQEICEYWIEGYKTGDEAILNDAIYGTLQLAFSNKTIPLITGLTNLTYPLLKKNWGPEHLDAYKIVTFEFLIKREEFSLEELSKIRVPVCLVHGLDDIAYPVKTSEEFRERLQSAGVLTSFHTISDAPHFISVERSRELNGILHDFLLQNTKELPPPIPTSQILSPWDADLRQNGWDPEEEEVDETVI
ncbi:hypothetical protein VKT23_018384 [Stygiomarasmius scandens]|uniref:Peptidase S9 prolyl oligopeptidase catalytic domain-containing protein n=1 Tax=Marasmiellus scandens TaxID=2682957 RepID=A0ABR1IRP4_9AGAR